MNQENPEVEGVEIPAEEMEQEAEAPESKPARQMNMIMFIGAIVLLLGFQATSSFLIVKKIFASNPYFPGSPPVEEETDLYGLIHTLEGIIVNPTDSRGAKVLLVDIGFETGSQDVIAELGSLEPLLRDNINTFLSAQRLPVLSDISMRDEIRNRVMEIANFHLKSGKVGRVFFIRYVLQ